MTPEEGKALPLGLYKIFWATGGSSLASLGMTMSGDRWIAPTNWGAGAVVRDKKDPEGRGISWEQIEKFEAIPDPAR